ncbi:hypothetical protein, partial [Acidithiobacillus ferriphilus]|uniref:hypothetical protein n=1 Tax=Acidithiobacillus ferriphilus TaxID=1689834 RepID=UPI001C070DF7
TTTLTPGDGKPLIWPRMKDSGFWQSRISDFAYLLPAHAARHVDHARAGIHTSGTATSARWIITTAGASLRSYWVVRRVRSLSAFPLASPIRSAAARAALFVGFVATSQTPLEYHALLRRLR